MNVSRLKNIMIVMLLAANLVLAAVLGSRSYEAWRLAEDATDRALAALASLGAEVPRELLSSEPSPLYRTEVERDLDAERALARAFIGESAERSDGSGVYRLAGENGSALLSGAGRFSVETGGAVACRDAAEFLAIGGLDAEGFALAPAAATQLIGGAPVFGRDLELVIEDGQLISADGGVLLGDDYIIDATPSKGLTAVLLSLAAELDDAGTPARAILSAELGYAASLAAPGYTLLEPTWRIETEGAGVWYVDALTLSSTAQLG